MKNPPWPERPSPSSVSLPDPYWSYHYSKNHFSTDDAQKTGHLHPVTSRIAHLSTIGIPLSQISGLSYRLIESRLLPQALLPSFNDVYAAVSIAALLILFPAFLFERPSISRISQS